MLLTAQDAGTDYPAKTAGPPLILKGYIPAGAPGGTWSKVRAGIEIPASFSSLVYGAPFRIGVPPTTSAPSLSPTVNENGTIGPIR